MKALKGSLVALVAILAVGLTVAMQAGAFETKVARVADCFTNAQILDLSASCANVTIAQGVANCNVVAGAPAGDAIFSLGSNLIDETTDCPGGTKFCCIDIVAQATTCPSHPSVDPVDARPLAQYRVAAVYCQLP